jgi:hypothetical protein
MTVQVPAVPTQSAQAATAGAITNPGAPMPHTLGVRFAFSAPEAHSVTIVGTFNGWDTHATPLHRDREGIWRVNVPLEAGRYAYMFIVDGKRWVLDPSAARDASDDFGTPNSVVMVSSAVKEWWETWYNRYAIADLPVRSLVYSLDVSLWLRIQKLRMHNIKTLRGLKQSFQHLFMMPLLHLPIRPNTLVFHESR